jgi:hypothetical protein
LLAPTPNRIASRAMRKPTSRLEDALAAILNENGIEHLREDSIDMPRVRHPETRREHRPDFFVPTTQLYIEVKGEMGMREIRKMSKLSQNPDLNYYLYQADDWDWDPQLGDWPDIDPAEVDRIQWRAYDARDAYLREHPTRVVGRPNP